ncbi:hypothetical protein ABW21_db0207177 [Orbilia brochopaga]|nr:hypothetical protein ABW21_db0207177 [Drechslerella brochopaga]
MILIHIWLLRQWATLKYAGDTLLACTYPSQNAYKWSITFLNQPYRVFLRHLSTGAPPYLPAERDLLNEKTRDRSNPTLSNSYSDYDPDPLHLKLWRYVVGLLRIHGQLLI